MKTLDPAARRRLQEEVLIGYREYLAANRIDHLSSARVRPVFEQYRAGYFDALIEIPEQNIGGVEARAYAAGYTAAKAA